MFKLSCNITITGSKTWTFSALTSCVINQDVEQLTDWFELEIAKRIVWEGDDDLIDGKPPIKRGDQIAIDLGYDDKLVRRFTGYITEVGAQTPVTIKGEDSMFVLKRTNIEPESFKSASLNDLISYLLKGTDFSYDLIDGSLPLGAYRVTKHTVAEELQALKESHLLNAYFRQIDGRPVLYVGLAYPFDNRNVVRFESGKNIIEEDFEYKHADTIEVRVEATSFDAENKKTTLELGDKGGDLIKIRIDGLTPGQLKVYAEKALKRYKRSGLKGSFKIFGIPEVNTCDIVDIVASDGSSGQYLIKKNDIDFGQNGYRQDIELGMALQVNDG